MGRSFLKISYSVIQQIDTIKTESAFRDLLNARIVKFFANEKVQEYMGKSATPLPQLTQNCHKMLRYVLTTQRKNLVNLTHAMFSTAVQEPFFAEIPKADCQIKSLESIKIDPYKF